jgi:hypothetical protein
MGKPPKQQFKQAKSNVKTPKKQLSRSKALELLQNKINKAIEAEERFIKQKTKDYQRLKEKNETLIKNDPQLQTELQPKITVADNKLQQLQSKSKILSVRLSTKAS